MKLGLLVSGDLGYAVLSLLKTQNAIVFVMTDKNSVLIKAYCINENIPCFIGNPRNEKSVSFIKNKYIDILMSVNYLFLIDENLINHPNILAFNIHGSLLPKYRGRTPHVWAIINGETYTGITAHLIDKDCDSGDIIYQEKIPISSDNTGGDILNIFKYRYPQIVIKILKDISSGNIIAKKQDENDSSYFPKRSPNDGRIDLSLDSKNIYNWVRAQSFPYPGAYLFYDSNRVIVDQVKIIDVDYDKSLKNGTVISVDPLLIKLKDGVIELAVLRDNKCTFKKNSILT